MADVLTIREAVKRARAEGMPVAECALRRWIRQGDIPHRMAGNKTLIYWPNVVAYLKGEVLPAAAPANKPLAVVSGIRRVEV